MKFNSLSCSWRYSLHFNSCLLKGFASGADTFYADTAVLDLTLEA